MGVFNKIKYILAVFLFFLFASSEVLAGANAPYDKIIFFGDSLSDNGNLYYYDFGFLPKAPTYYQGRFSNGPVWSEHFADYYKNNFLIGSANYAVGGETTLFHNPIGGFLPYTLTASYDDYIVRNVFSSHSTTLYVILIGANDYLNGSKEVDPLTTNVINNIKETIEKLFYHGGKNFLVINLPDLSKTPYAAFMHEEKNLHDLTLAHNAKLAAVIDELTAEHKEMNIHLYNMSAFFDQATHDVKPFNEKYGKNITNLNEACWGGGYTMAYKPVPKATPAVISQSLEEYLNQQSKLMLAGKTADQGILARNLNTLDRDNLSSTIANSPGLLQAFQTNQLQQAGYTACSNPDNYLFWDKVHPTRIAHEIIAGEIIHFVNEHYTHI